MALVNEILTKRPKISSKKVKTNDITLHMHKGRPVKSSTLTVVPRLIMPYVPIHSDVFKQTRVNLANGEKKSQETCIRVKI